MTIRVQAQPFDPSTELNALHAANLGIGAVVTFVGYVRDFNEGREVGGMFLEHFPGMTERLWPRSPMRPVSAGRCWASRSSTASVVWSRVSPSSSSAPAAPIARPRSMPATSSWIT